MGFLTDAERQELRIVNMILHVVGDGEFEPQEARNVEHAQFFLSRIRDTDIAGVHKFRQQSDTRDLLACMAEGTVAFQDGAQTLARDFSRVHRTTARDGAFFIFELAVADPDVKIYSFIKYDYREAIEQAVEMDGQQRLRQIVHAFIDDKKAIQKSALIRVAKAKVDEVISAKDRTKPSPDIADYFSAFLEVDRGRSDEELTKALVEVVRATLVDSIDLLPEKDAAAALKTAKAVLRERQRIDEDAIVDAVLAAAGQPNEAAQEILRNRVGRRLRKQRLAGLEFPPDRKQLKKPALRKLRTTEGVTVTYPDGVAVERAPREGGKGEIITISTEHVVEATVVREATR